MKWRTRFVLAFLLGHMSYGICQDTHESTLLQFVPNQGQIADRNYNPRPDILYQVEGKGVFLSKTGISYVFSNVEEVNHEVHEAVEAIEETDKGFGGQTEGQLKRQLLADSRYKVQQISMHFLDINPDFEIVNRGQSADYLNYYLPQCPNGIVKVKTSSEIIYSDLYKGIDAQFYGTKHGDLKYDFVVHPGADPKQIELAWTGADSVFINEAGQLVLDNQIKELFEALPKVYQNIQGEIIDIPAAYRIKLSATGRPIVSFSLGNYDTENTLIIDPWVTNYGGENNDFGLRVATDDNGFAYLMGISNSVTNISMDGFQSDVGGLIDGFLVKFNPAGVRQWGTYYGGELSEAMGTVACDRANFIYICGSTPSHDGISAGGYQNNLTVDPLTDSGVDAFLVKFNDAGMRIWGTYYGGTGVDNGYGIATDSERNVYLSGSTNSGDSIAFDGHDMTVSGFDAYLVKFTEDGDRIWGTYYGGWGGDVGLSVAVDSLNNVFLGGPTESSTDIGSGGYDLTLGGSGDLFVAKFSPLGVRMWATYAGGELGEGGGYVAVDTIGCVYISGNTASETGIGIGGFQNSLVPGGLWNQDAFVTKYDVDGDLLWSTYYGGNDRDYSLGCAVDPKTNNILVSGDVYSTNLSMSPCAIQPELIGLENVFLIQFFENGDLFCASYFGSSHEEDNTIAVHGCYTYITGTTPVGVATPGSHQESFGGVNDAFLAQIYTQSCGLEYPVTTIISEQVNVPVCGDCVGEASVQLATEGCYGSPALISYEWSTGLEIDQTTDTSSYITDLCPGDYWVAVTYNCDQVDTIFFEIIIEGVSPIIVDFASSDVCLGEPITFMNESVNDPLGPITSFWSFGDTETSTESDPEHTFTEPGVYEVTLVITNETGCQDSIKKEVEVFPIYDSQLYWTICADSVLRFPDGTEESVSENTIRTYDFETEAGCDSLITVEVIVYPNYFRCDTIYADPYETIIYPDGTVQTVPYSLQHRSIFNSSQGCDSIILTKVIVAEYEQAFFPPNIFSPGSDQANNLFFFPSKGVEIFQCVVVNRWGVEVFRFNSIADTWDGTNAQTGSECTDGVYFYKYSGNFVSGEILNGQGTIQLVRD